MGKDLKLYKVKVTSDLYIRSYEIRAENLFEASRQARIKFGKSFNQVGSNVKVSLDPSDLKNHINEILEAFTKA